MWDIMKVSHFKVISAIIVSEMSVHISVIGKIARDAPSVLQVSMTRRNFTLKVAISSAYEQFSMCDI